MHTGAGTSRWELSSNVMAAAHCGTSLSAGRLLYPTSVWRSGPPGFKLRDLQERGLAHREKSLISQHARHTIAASPPSPSPVRTPHVLAELLNAPTVGDTRRSKTDSPTGPSSITSKLAGWHEFAWGMQRRRHRALGAQLSCNRGKNKVSSMFISIQTSMHP
jgi:hypothetical protein